MISPLSLPPSNELATKPRRIFQALRIELLEGQHKPGSRLSLRPLAKRFDVGINTVAAALRALETEGLVECEAKVGARVCIRDIAAVRSDFILRLALETEAVRQCAANFSSIHATSLELLAEKADALALDEELGSAREADQHFHLGIARLAEAPSLAKSLAQLLPRLVILEHGDPSEPENRAISHRGIAQAIGKGEVEAIEAIREHIEDAQKWAIGHLVSFS